MRGTAWIRETVRELNRRRVWQVAFAYLTAGLAAAIATNELQSFLPLPPWTPTLVLVLVIAGFPVALVLAWAYQLQPDKAGADRMASIEVPGLLATSDENTRPKHVSAETSRRSIVVLPFDNLSPDPSDAYFSDGLTEEIITNLSYLRGLRVISRNSAMVLKGTAKDTRTIGRELDVGYVLEGSVRKAGDALRITAQLIDARTDAHLWARKYDGVLQEVFGIQESVARSIADAMELELSPDECRRLSEHPIADSSAYQAYLRARQLCWEFTSESLAKARQEMQNGLDLVGPNPLFYAGLAYVHWALYDSGIQYDQGILDEGEEYARRALELDPGLPQAWCSRGMIRYKRGDMAGHVRDLRRAARLGLTSDVSGFLAFTLGEVGRSEESLAHGEKAVASDPLSAVPNFARACSLLFAGRTRSALGHIRDTHARLGMGDGLVGWWHAQIAAHAHEEEEACIAASDVAAMDQGIVSDFCRLLPPSLEGDREGVLRILDSTDLRRVARTDEYYPVFLANNLASVGEHDEALDWIEQAIGWGFTNHVFLSEHNRFLAPLREHPRFIDLMERARCKLEAFDA